MKNTQDEMLAVAMERAIAAEKERDDLQVKLEELIQAIRKFPADVSFVGDNCYGASAREMFDWIEATCPWLEEIPNEQNQ